MGSRRSILCRLCRTGTLGRYQRKIIITVNVGFAGTMGQRRCISCPEVIKKRIFDTSGAIEMQCKISGPERIARILNSAGNFARPASTPARQMRIHHDSPVTFVFAGTAVLLPDPCFILSGFAFPIAAMPTLLRYRSRIGNSAAAPWSNGASRIWNADHQRSVFSQVAGLNSLRTAHRSPGRSTAANRRDSRASPRWNPSGRIGDSDFTRSVLPLSVFPSRLRAPKHEPCSP